MKHITLYLLFNLFNIVEYGLITYYIYRLVKNGAFKTVMIALSAAFILLAGFRMARSSNDTFDSLSLTLESIFLIIYSIYYLFEQMRSPDHLFFYSIPDFWIIVGVLLYFSGTFFINIYAQSMIKDESFQFQYQLINPAFYILKNVLFAVAMFVNGGGPKSKLSSIDFSNLDEHLNLNR